MNAIEVQDPAGLDAALERVPNHAAVFLLWPAAGDPYLARTALLRRRLLRMLRAREKPSRILNLRDTVRRIEYSATGSALESSVVMYEIARRHFPETYLELLKLRLPSYVKLLAANPFPRTTVSARLGRGPALCYGPFRTRASAERFEAQFLELFQIRRCQEDLEPSPEHPGCIYGEMGMCLRPCQQVVGADEYRHEAERVAEFLSTGGRSLLETIAKARDRLSEDMDFEAAARQHKRLEKVQDVLKLSDELARDVDRLHGAAITRSVEAGAVQIWPVRAGVCLPSQTFRFEGRDGRAVSLDQRLRELFAGLATPPMTPRERQERLALFSRWFYSTWRDGDWIAFDDLERIPYRRLVHAVSRMAHGGAVAHQETLPL